MWAHCFLIDWPLDKPKCSSPQSSSPHCSALARWVTVTCPVLGMNIAKCTIIRPGEVRTSVLWSQPWLGPGQDRQDRRFVGTFCPPWFSSLSGIVLHYFSFVLVSLPAYVASTYCLLLQLRLCQGLYSISSFTYCARFVFSVSYLASWFTFFLI